MVSQQPDLWAVSVSAQIPAANLWLDKGWELVGPSDIRIPTFMRAIPKSKETYKPAGTHHKQMQMSDPYLHVSLNLLIPRKLKQIQMSVGWGTLSFNLISPASARRRNPQQTRFWN